jgi:hypothetical protein
MLFGSWCRVPVFVGRCLFVGYCPSFCAFGLGVVGVRKTMEWENRRRLWREAVVLPVRNKRREVLQDSRAYYHQSDGGSLAMIECSVSSRPFVLVLFDNSSSASRWLSFRSGDGLERRRAKETMKLWRGSAGRLLSMAVQRCVDHAWCPVGWLVTDR